MHPEVEDAFFRLYGEQHGRAARLFPGIRRALDAAKAQGLRLGLLTGKGRRATEISLRAFGLLESLDAVVTGDEAPRPKPDPDGLVMLLRQLDVSATEALFVGDSSADIGAGARAGVRTALARWNHAAEASAVAASQADLVLDRVEDLKRLIRSAAPAVAAGGGAARG
jgi:phosphoglycolate phosphatase/pyrophosphatase PpaX